jgi:oxygen-dependent protoporphyrinogen oxidase
MKPHRVVIVGGGVTGLVCALRLGEWASAKRLPVDVTVLEADTHFGGHLRSERVDEFLVDTGPDSWVLTKPHAAELARHIGLGAELIATRPEARRVYIAHNGQLHPLPEGLVLGVPTELLPLAATRLLSLRGKARAAMEPLVPRRAWGDDDDESIGGFLSRRLGTELTDRIAAPLLGGIFAGDASAISVRFTFPSFVEAEARHGSLVRAMRVQKVERARIIAEQEGKSASRNGAAPRPSAFMTVRSGVGTFIERLSQRVSEHATLRSGVRVTKLTRLPKDDPRGRWFVELGSGGLLADTVVLAAPAAVSGALLAGVDEPASQSLRAIPFASTATVFLAFDAGAVGRPLDASGFLVPKSEGRPLLASTWVSSKWQGRAPAGKVLLRAFFGGPAGEEVLERDDEALGRLAFDELDRVMGFSRPPLFRKVYRYLRASPQPLVGHGKRVKALQARVEAVGGLHVAGGGIGGVGIPDCVRQGEDVAARIVAGLADDAN